MLDTVIGGRRSVGRQATDQARVRSVAFPASRVSPAAHRGGPTTDNRGGGIEAAPQGPAAQGDASFAFMASARASAPFSGRTITVNSVIAPVSSRCRKSQPSISRAPIRARNTSA